MTPKSLVLSSSVASGRLEVTKRQWEQLKLALKRWPDMPVELEIRPWLETRRARANRWLWGVVYKLMAAESGHTADELHALMKLRHNPKVVEEATVGGSTRKMTIAEFSEFIEACMADGTEWFSIIWPEPRPTEDWRRG